MPETSARLNGQCKRHPCITRGATSEDRDDLCIPGGQIGARAKLLTVYGRDYLGISLGKTTDLVRELFGPTFSTAAACVHLKWCSTRFACLLIE